MDFFKKHKKFFLYGIFPFIILIVTFSLYAKMSQKQVIESGQGINTNIPDAVIDTTQTGKGEAYDQKAAQAKKNAKDPYDSYTDAKTDFNLISPNKGNNSQPEQSMEIQAKIEEQKHNSIQNNKVNSSDQSEYVKNQKKLRDLDIQTAQAYQQPVPKPEVPAVKLVNRSFNSVKVSEQVQSVAYDPPSPSGSAVISASVMKDIKVSTNTPIVIRLLQNTEIGGIEFEKNTIINGIANLAGDRIDINLQGSSIRGKSVDYSFTVYDSDGLPGIKVSGIENGEVAHNTYSQQIQSIGSNAAARLGTVGSIGASLLGSIGSKGSRVKIPVPAGYKLTLRVN